MEETNNGNALQENKRLSIDEGNINISFASSIQSMAPSISTIGTLLKLTFVIYPFTGTMGIISIDDLTLGRATCGAVCGASPSSPPSSSAGGNGPTGCYSMSGPSRPDSSSTIGAASSGASATGA
ncbi:hypothetical protein AVEN_12415-1 [Araneus ventricosus]|uniref:Uncharacterized protein n=1 Tax=Araneus ventricosus TaxID=182803 RepID=A0A4Y2UHU0_ARAVE|nr:hypothetical protein AVEN_12415-1 [Araneus ventricosus]